MPAGGNSRFRGYPSRMSERQQLALILQMTSQDVPGSGSSSRSESNSVSNARSSPVHHHKNSAKSRWSNKSSELQDANTQLSQQDDRLHGLSSCDSKERNEFAGSISPDEVRQASGAESPLAAGSPAESAATCTTSAAAAAPDNPATISQDQDDCEMRGTPLQNKVDRSTSSSSSSLSSSGIHQRSQEHQRGRVLKLVQVRSTRDEKKPIIGPCSSSISSSGGGGDINSGGALHQGQAHHHLITGTSSSRLPVLSSNQMDSSSQKSSNTGGASSSTMTGVTSSGGNSTGGANSSASSADGGDVYEFKSSKEATPVRGSSSSPNPNMDKDGKESTTSSVGGGSLCGGNQNIGSGSANPSGNPPTGGGGPQNPTSALGCSNTTGTSSTSLGLSSSSALSSSLATSGTTDDPMMSSTTSPQSSSAKRAFDSEGSLADDQDEESRKRKKKDVESAKDSSGAKANIAGRQNMPRSNPCSIDKNAKPGKQAVGATSVPKSNQMGSGISSSSSSTIGVGGNSGASVSGGGPSSSSDRKSPSSSLTANSPKPSTAASSTGASSKGVGTPSGSIESDGEDDRSKGSDCSSAPKVPPLKIVIPQSAEQEQGNRNGKNLLNRSHQLPYVVASSNNSNDSMDKEMSGAPGSGATSPLDGSASKGSNASGAADDKKDFSGNGNYSNSSPLPANSADRSNNSSPQQQRHHSPTPESTGAPMEQSSGKPVDLPVQNSPAGKNSSNPSGSNSSNTSSGASTTDKSSEKNVEVKKESVESSDAAVKKENPGEATSSSSSQQQAQVDLHPRKRKLKSSKEAQQAAATAAAVAAASEPPEPISSGPEVHPHDQPITNCVQLFLNIRRQIDRRRKGLFPVQPKPPQGFKDYLMNRCTYVLAGNANKEPNINPPPNLTGPMKDLYIEQEKERYRLRMQHVVEKEKLVLSVEQEILRVHGRAARALANQSLPFSVCTILKDEEVYNVITPEQEEKDRNARSRYNGRLFLSWLQDVDDKWEKIK
ncbi:hypothetical protein QAD02_001110, partial [Eretmocerus hayati]